jgi:LPXTG-motif cell wall-anchored protein
VNGAAGTAASAASDDGAGSNVDGIAVGSSQKRLATTGMEQTWPVGIAAALALTAGGLWMVALRRRRTRSDEG